MASVERLKDGDYMALFHDDGRFLQGEGKKSKFRVYKTISHDGGRTWGQPEVIAEHPDADLCEPGLVRSPDGKQIAVLLRENSRKHNSFVIFSDDEGKTWTEPRELPGSLTGDRHVGKYAPDGRLFVSFRDTTHESPTKGDWVGWVGTYDDIVAGREGQYRVRLMDNTKGIDCAYPGVEVLPDGTFVATTYGHWAEGEPPYIVSVRFTLAELDALAKARPKAGPEPPAAAGSASPSSPGRPRLVVLTDISSLTAGEAEPDDGQSLIRLMLYTNEFDIEGLVASSNLGHGQKVRPELIRRVVDAYEQGAAQPAPARRPLPARRGPAGRHQGGAAGRRAEGAGRPRASARARTPRRRTGSSGSWTGPTPGPSGWSSGAARPTWRRRCGRSVRHAAPRNLPASWRSCGSTPSATRTRPGRGSGSSSPACSRSPSGGPTGGCTGAATPRWPRPSG